MYKLLQILTPGLTGPGEKKVLVLIHAKLDTMS